MKPGRELDALIAHKIFGETWMSEHLLYVKNAEKNIEQANRENRATADQVNLPFEESMAYIKWAYYSTDISAAWEVVEKIKFMQPNWDAFGLKPDHMQMFTIEYTGMSWRAGWATINLDGNMTIEAESENAPHAICLAALKAVGVMVE